MIFSIKIAWLPSLQATGILTFKPVTPLLSPEVGGEGRSVSDVSTPAQKIWTPPLSIFLSHFNYCSHSPMTGWPTTSALAWLTQRSTGRLSATNSFLSLFLLLQELASLFFSISIFYKPFNYKCIMLLKSICINTSMNFEQFLI